MSEIDIRTGNVTELTAIRIADKRDDDHYVDLIKRSEDDPRELILQDSDSDYNAYLVLANEEHVKNLILGLQKAVSLGWFKKKDN